MSDHPTILADKDRLQQQIQCIIVNQFDFMFMTDKDRRENSERAAEIIMKLIGGSV